jgi:hypothetical protein
MAQRTGRPSSRVVVDGQDQTRWLQRMTRGADPLQKRAVTSSNIIIGWGPVQWWGSLPRWEHPRQDWAPVPSNMVPSTGSSSAPSVACLSETWHVAANSPEMAPLRCVNSRPCATGESLGFLVRILVADPRCWLLPSLRH